MSERRLHAVDSPEPEGPAISPGGGGGGGSRIEERLAALETHLQYLATKEDIQKLKIWVLGGVIAAGVAGLELIRIRGHLTLWGGGIHHAEIKTAVRAGVPAPDG